MTNMSMTWIRPGKRLVLVLAAMALLLGSHLATAQPDGDRHVWVQAVAVLGVSENWRLHLEEQPRWFDDGTALFQNILRTAVGRRVGGRASVWAGHAWVAKPPGPGVKHEQRAWQQVLVTPPPAGGWVTSLRWRQEQRWQPDWDGTSQRIRLMARAAHSIGSSRWLAVLWEEAMVTLSATGGGPPKGFDQNRLFGGVSRRVSPHATVDAGYMWFAVRQPSGQRSDGHVTLATVNLTF